MTTISLHQIPRAEKRTIAQAIHTSLVDHHAQAGSEPGLDAFTPQLADVAVALSTHVSGKTVADAARITRLAAADGADDAVDTWLRHLESFLSIEGHRRSGALAARVLAFHDAAFPDGLAHVDERIVDENRHCSASLLVLEAPEHAPVIAEIELPTAWIGKFRAAIAASEAANDAVLDARTDKESHTANGRDAEAEWIDLMVRLRRYVGSRAKRTDKARVKEGHDLLRPLLETLQKLRVDAATRATRKKNDAAEAPPTAPAAVVTAAAPAVPAAIVKTKAAAAVVTPSEPK
jgi:hypothetical protein